MRTRVRAPGEIVEARRPVGLVPIDPLVPGPTADPVPVTELGDGEEAALVVGNESNLLVHG